MARVIASNGWDVPTGRSPQQAKQDAQATHYIISAPTKQEAIDRFISLSPALTHVTYWQLLSTLWVDSGTVSNGESGSGNYEGWRNLFLCGRPKQKHLMKPDERVALKRLPRRVKAYRACAPDQHLVFNFSLRREVAEAFPGEVREFELDRDKIIALFKRRNEAEIICFDIA